MTPVAAAVASSNASLDAYDDHHRHASTGTNTSAPAFGVEDDAPGLTCLGDNIATRFVAETRLPTSDGVFRVRAYRSRGSLRESEPIAMVSGDVAGKSGVVVRVHDQCFTSEVFGSLKCDCKEQLQFAKEYTRAHGGVVIYMPQEGRGIGLANKIMAYAMQEKGLDTVDANRVLGFKDDYRSYEPVKAILQDLGIKSIRLLTNNPRKIRLLSQLGITVDGRLPVIIEGGEHSQGYLTAKAKRMAHLLPDGSSGVKIVATELSSGASTSPSSPSHSDSEDTATDESSQDEDDASLGAQEQDEDDDESVASPTSSASPSSSSSPSVTSAKSC